MEILDEGVVLLFDAKISWIVKVFYQGVVLELVLKHLYTNYYLSFHFTSFYLISLIS